ncbi:hypothetical protein ABZ532_01530 [Streptomyces sp. NPDC019396]|uniref:hypothetical protein n=1 Tax=Streptomyces sp. NPDC019396 TaxID=3154687 RepID=UPI00340C1770
MGWTALYIAFGIVALWLLGEVLLQYKARLRWRLLAFVGFLGVVLGVLLPNVIVIGVGAVCFAVGQTYVTLSFRRGFSTGWAIGGKPGASRRRKASGAGAAAQREPTLEVSDLAYEPGADEQYEPYEPREPHEGVKPVYEPVPLPDDTSQYGVYEGYGSYSSPYEQPSAAQAQDAYAAQYDYGAGQQQYAAYSDPYVGTPSYGSYDDPYAAQQSQQQYGDPYATQQGYQETPPGGVWVPQQRDGDQEPQAPQQSYGYPNTGYEYGYDGYENGQQQPYRY